MSTHSKGEAANVSAKLAQKKTSSAALLANGERCTDEGAARALDSDQDRDHGIPISLCCRMRMVVVTGSTFEILGFFFFPASRESRDSTALGKSLRGAARRAVATERGSTFEFKNRRALLASHRRYPSLRSPSALRLPCRLFRFRAACPCAFARACVGYVLSRCVPCVSLSSRVCFRFCTSQS